MRKYDWVCGHKRVTHPESEHTELRLDIYAYTGLQLIERRRKELKQNRFAAKQFPYLKFVVIVK